MKTTTHTVSVQFGDCDPAGIVFFPNFSRWMDAASLAFFVQCGVPTMPRVLTSSRHGGTPLLEIHTKFVKAATYGETLVIATCVNEWRGKAFIQHHRVTRDGELICEGSETRVFVIRDAQDADRLRAIPVPEDIRALCS